MTEGSGEDSIDWRCILLASQQNRTEIFIGSDVHRQIVKRNADDLVAMTPVGTLDRFLTRVYTEYIPLFGAIRSTDKPLQIYIEATSVTIRNSDTNESKCAKFKASHPNLYKSTPGFLWGAYESGPKVDANIDDFLRSSVGEDEKSNIARFGGGIHLAAQALQPKWTANDILKPSLQVAFIALVLLGARPSPDTLYQ